MRNRKEVNEEITFSVRVISISHLEKNSNYALMRVDYGRTI